MRKVTIFLAMILVASAAFADEAETLRLLFDEDWEWQLRDNPESATSLGDKRYDDRLTDRSSDAWARRREHANDMLARIQAIDRAKLTVADQLNYDLFLYQARQAAEGVRFPA